MREAAYFYHTFSEREIAIEGIQTGTGWDTYELRPMLGHTRK